MDPWRINQPQPTEDSNWMKPQDGGWYAEEENLNNEDEEYPMEF
jgi:hypothetical protein